MLQQIRQAREHLKAVRASLLSSDPSELALGVEQMQLAVNCASAVTQEVRSNSVSDPKTRQELHELRKELNVLGRLAEHGLQLQVGWATILASAFNGYTDSGINTPLAAPGQVCVQG